MTACGPADSLRAASKAAAASPWHHAISAACRIGLSWTPSVQQTSLPCSLARNRSSQYALTILLFSLVACRRFAFLMTGSFVRIALMLVSPILLVILQKLTAMAELCL